MIVTNISWLRIIGLVCCIASTMVAFYRLRRHRQQRRLDWFMVFTALVLGLIAACPSLVNMPATLFQLDAMPGGRIMTLLIVISGVTWFTLIRVKQRHALLVEQVEALLHQQILQRVDVALYQRYRDQIMILMPAYNEAAHIGAVLSTIPASIADHQVLTVVINDCSDDETKAIAAQSAGCVLDCATRVGQGTALRAGYRLAKLIRPKVVVTMDADGQHRAEDIATVIAPILSADAQIVLGSRRYYGHYDDTPLLRKVGISVFSQLISWLINQRITDCASGFRAFDLKTLQSLTLKQPQYQTAELIIEAAKSGYRINETAIKIEPRLSGESKKGHSLRYGFHFFSSIMRTWLR